MHLIVGAVGGERTTAPSTRSPIRMFCVNCAQIIDAGWVFCPWCRHAVPDELLQVADLPDSVAALLLRGKRLGQVPMEELLKALPKKSSECMANAIFRRFEAESIQIEMDGELYSSLTIGGLNEEEDDPCEALTPIEQLGLPHVTVGYLKKAGISTLHQLLQMTGEEIAGIDKIGEESARQILVRVSGWAVARHMKAQ